MKSTVVTKLFAMVALSAVAMGCGSTEADTIVSANGEDRRLVPMEAASDEADLDEHISSAMGGVRFSVEPEHHLYSAGDTIVVSISDPRGEAAWEAVTVGLLTQTADGIAIESVGQVLDLVSSQPSAVVTPTETAIEVLGYNLAGYDIRADASTRDVWFYASDRIGNAPLSLFGFLPNARIFLGQTPAGVLVAGSTEADDPDDLPALEATLGTLVSTMEATGDGLDARLPDGQTLELPGVTESAARGELDPDGPDALDAPFSPVAAGTYQVANFGDTFTIELTEDWFVQPNFPGIMVLTAPRSGGPGDRDVVFATGMVDIVPIAAGPVAVGDSVPVATADDLIDVLEADLDVTDRQDVDLGGVAATRFDVQVPVDALCTQDDRCEYAIRSSSGFVKPLNSISIHRIWWIEDGAEGPSMIIAMAPPGDDFIELATQAIDTIEFN